jgi:hypothetical protein
MPGNSGLPCHGDMAPKITIKQIDRRAAFQGRERGQFLLSVESYAKANLAHLAAGVSQQLCSAGHCLAVWTTSSNSPPHRLAISVRGLVCGSGLAIAPSNRVQTS